MHVDYFVMVYILLFCCLQGRLKSGMFDKRTSLWLWSSLKKETRKEIVGQYHLVSCTNFILTTFGKAFNLRVSALIFIQGIPSITLKELSAVVTTMGTFDCLIYIKVKSFGKRTWRMASVVLTLTGRTLQWINYWWQHWNQSFTFLTAAPYTQRKD